MIQILRDEQCKQDERCKLNNQTNHATQ